jgi:hypothetical protein
MFGAFLIISGVAVTLSNQSQTASMDSPIFNAIFLLAHVPICLGSIVKEISLSSQTNMDQYYLDAWIAVFQLIFGILSFPVSFHLDELHIAQRQQVTLMCRLSPFFFI